MKPLFIILLIFFNCIDQKDKGSLSGKWTLICYVNFDTNERTYRPVHYVPSQLTFEFNDNGQQGKFHGRTTTNKVNGEYSLYHNLIHVSRFGGTKINEIGWGENFWSDIYNSTSYQYKNDTLIILFEEDTKGMFFIPAEK